MRLPFRKATEPALVSELPQPAGPAQAQAGEPEEPQADEFAAGRARNRKRLMGAAVLLGLGVVLFPMVFETQPRAPGQTRVSGSVAQAPAPAPTPSQTATQSTTQTALQTATPAATPTANQTASGATVAPLTSTTAKAASAVASAGPVAAIAPPSETAVALATAAAIAAAPSRAKPDAAADAAVQSKPPAKPLLPKPSVPAPAVAPAPSAAAPAAAPSGERFVVQVGAFAEAKALREVRQRVEKLNLKTYTQVVQTPGGERTRVRVGPFSTKAQAEAAQAKLKTAGIGGTALLEL